MEASGNDEFLVFVLPTNLTEDKQVVAVDFRAGNPRVVHHVVSFVDTSGTGRKLDAADPGPGYSSGPGGIRIPTAQIQGVWAPGNLPRFLPDGVGRPLPKGSDVVIQMHYHKTGRVDCHNSSRMSWAGSRIWVALGIFTPTRYTISRSSMSLG